MTLNFSVRIRNLSPDYDQQARQNHPENPFCGWKPPTIPNAYIVDSGPFYNWENGQMREVPAQEYIHLYVHRETSMFFCQACQTVKQVPYDCTTRSVQESASKHVWLDWSPLGLSHYQAATPSCIAIFGHYFHGHTEANLRVAALPHLMREFIPERLRYQNGREIAPEFVGPCHIAGDLSVLVGLAALSAPPHRFQETMENSFNFGRPWRPHYSLDENLNLERGVVATVAVDDRQGNIKHLKNHLTEIESGMYGPIICGDSPLL